VIRSVDKPATLCAAAFAMILTTVRSNQTSDALFEGKTQGVSDARFRQQGGFSVQ